MKLKKSINRQTTGRIYHWLVGMVCLLVICTGSRAMAQDSYTINVPEQLTGKTTVKLPFKSARNVSKFRIETTENVVLSSNGDDSHSMTVSGKVAEGTFSSTIIDSDKIVFDMETTGGTPLAAGEYAFTIVMESRDGCSSDVRSFKVHVAAKPVIELMDPVTVCQGEARNVAVTAKTFTPASGASLKYKWTAVLTSGDGLTFGAGDAVTENAYASGNNLITDNVTSASNAPAVITYTVTPIAEYTFGSKTIKAEGETKTVTVTVNPAVDIKVTPLAQTVGCGTPTQITMSSDNTGGTSTWDWTIKNKGTNITNCTEGSGETIAQTLINAGASEETVTYEVTHRFENGGVTCKSSSEEVVVTVLPTVDLIVATAGNTVCSRGTTTVALSTGNTGAGSHAYTWEVKGASPADVTIAEGAGVTKAGSVYTGTLTGTASELAMTLTNSGSKAEDLTFTVTHAYTLNGKTCNKTEDVVLTVNPTINVSADDELICSGGTTNILMSTTNTGNASASSKFTWKLKEDALPAGVSLGALSAGVTEVGGVYSNTNSNTLAMTLTNSGTEASTVSYVVTHEFSNNGVVCSEVKEVVVTVVPSITIEQVEESTLCSEDTKTVAFATTGNVEHINYSWSFTFNPEKMEVSGTDVTVVGDKATGTGSFAVTLKNKSDDTVFITVAVKAVYDTSACEATGTFVINVNPKPVFELGE